MIYFALYKPESGEIQISGAVPSEEYLFGYEQSDLNLITSGQPIDIASFWVVDGALSFRGGPPSDVHVWNGEEWVVDESMLSTQLESSVRSTRNRLLKMHIDSMNPMRWFELTEEQKQAWSIYRQALLDVPQQDGFPRNVVWPSKPQ